MLTAKEAVDRAPSPGALVATADLIKNQPEFLQNSSASSTVLSRLRTPAAGRRSSENVQTPSGFSGAARGYAGRIAVSVYAGQRAGERNWLGGGKDSKLAQVLHDTAEFLKEQQKITTVLDDYSAFIDPRFVSATLASN